MDPMSSYSWLYFALGTVVTWGLYGIFLHMGQMGMADPVNGRYKAFLFVGSRGHAKGIDLLKWHPHEWNRC